MSHDVSLNRSHESLDIEEINGNTAKKKVIKKKIIKKIVKKKNVDGTDVPAEVTTVIIENKKNEEDDDHRFDLTNKLS